MNPLNPKSQFNIESVKDDLVAGFTITKDGSAIREIESEGKKLKITVFFPKDVKSHDREARLKGFTQDKLEAAAKYAVSVGLGDPSKKVKAVTFFEDDKGHLENVQKVLTGDKVKPINLDYSKRIKAATDAKKDDKKIGKLQKQGELFFVIQKQWNNNHKAESLKEEVAPPSKNVNASTPKKSAPPKKTIQSEPIKVDAKEPSKVKEVDKTIENPDDEVSDEELSDLEDKAK
jgi:hypothetical protein